MRRALDAARIGFIIRTAKSCDAQGHRWEADVPWLAGPHGDDRIGGWLKFVFPMPNGNATVVLRPENLDGSGLRLVSAGTRMGDTGFYRIGRVDADTLRVWRI